MSLYQKQNKFSIPVGDEWKYYNVRTNNFKLPVGHRNYKSPITSYSNNPLTVGGTPYISNDNQYIDIAMSNSDNGLPKREGRKFDPNYEYEVSDPRTVVAPGFMGAGARAKAFSPMKLNLAQRDKIAKGENLMGLLRNKPRTGLMRG